MKILVTGGCGYIGSALVAALMRRGDQVCVLDDLWFGGEALLPFFDFNGFELIKGDVCDDDLLFNSMAGVDCVIHLAAIVGFPACEKAGRESVWRINVDGTKKVYEAACRAGVQRLIFASSYSSYGESQPGDPVTEESPLRPKSDYAVSKVEAESFLLSRNPSQTTVPICLRLATVFGVSPRTRFDLIVNQFVLDACNKGQLEIYQEDFRRSFVHVRDVVRAMILMTEAPLETVGRQVFNIGTEQNNISKQELVELIRRHLPELRVVFRNTSFAGDMRSIHVSFDKIRKTLGFESEASVGDGIDEMLSALRQGVISNPHSEKFRNHPALLL